MVISYAPLWETMKRVHASTYTLQQNGISSSSIRRMKAGDSVSTHTLDALCTLLNCSLGDVIEYIPPRDQEPQEIAGLNQGADNQGPDEV